MYYWWLGARLLNWKHSLLSPKDCNECLTVAYEGPNNSSKSTFWHAQVLRLHLLQSLSCHLTSSASVTWCIKLTVLRAVETIAFVVLLSFEYLSISKILVLLFPLLLPSSKLQKQFLQFVLYQQVWRALDLLHRNSCPVEPSLEWL